jgi:predicted O-methyltransferase YrrM
MSLFHRSFIAKSTGVLVPYTKILGNFGGGIILEIGTNKGGSSIFTALALLSMKKEFIIHTFDPNDPGTQFKNLLDTLSLHGIIKYHRGLSPKDTVAMLRETGIKIDMLIIDGSHDPDDTIRDFNKHREFLSKGSVVVVDDVRTRDNKWGAWKLVNSLKGEDGVTISTSTKARVDGIAEIRGAEIA